MSEDLQRAQQRLTLDALDEQIDALEGKAVTRADRLALLDLRIEQLGARLALAQQDGEAAIEGKAIAGMSSDMEADFGRFIRRIGGHVQGGGRAQDVLDYDAPHFERAVSLIRGEAEPDSDDEAKALERWRAKHGS